MENLTYYCNLIHFYSRWELPRKVPVVPSIINRLAPYPTFIEVEVTTRCNLRCSICEHTYWHEPGKDMSLKEFKYIIDQFPDLKWIGLTGIGESFLNKEFMQMLEYVRSKGILVELYDAFYFIDEDVARELVRLGIHRIFASIDGATTETYEKIRIGSDFKRVTENLVYLVYQKHIQEVKLPKLALHYIVTKDNVYELGAFINLACLLIPGEITSIQFSRMLHSFPEVEGLFTEVSQEIIDEANKTARKLGVRVVWGLDVPKVKPPMSKCIEWTMPFIFVDGTVVPCCAGNEANSREQQRATALGNIFETPFREMWKGINYSTLRWRLRNREAPSACRNCCLYEIGRTFDTTVRTKKYRGETI